MNISQSWHTTVELHHLVKHEAFIACNQRAEFELIKGSKLSDDAWSTLQMCIDDENTIGTNYQDYLDSTYVNDTIKYADKMLDAALFEKSPYEDFDTEKFLDDLRILIKTKLGENIPSPLVAANQKLDLLVSQSNLLS